MPTTHLLIKGKVQGVFFRATAKEVAQEISVTGWIRNTDEGDVEALITGNKESIQRFIDWCKHGPPDAKVDQVIAAEKEETSKIFRQIFYPTRLSFLYELVWR